MFANNSFQQLDDCWWISRISETDASNNSQWPNQAMFDTWISVRRTL